MKWVIRRNYTSDGRRITPVTVFDVEQRGAIAIYARCIACKHRVEIAIDDVDPELFVPDVGLGMKCGQCGGVEIDTWPRLSISRPPPAQTREELQSLADVHGIGETFRADLARLDRQALAPGVEPGRKPS